MSDQKLVTISWAINVTEEYRLTLPASELPEGWERRDEDDEAYEEFVNFVVEHESRENLRDSSVEERDIEVLDA